MTCRVGWQIVCLLGFVIFMTYNYSITQTKWQNGPNRREPHLGKLLGKGEKTDIKRASRLTSNNTLHSYNTARSITGTPWYTQEPFQVWNVHKSYDSLQRLGLTSNSMFMKVVLPETSGRLATKLQKALQGSRLKMAVIGGSHAAGGGIDYVKHAFQRVVTDWWNKVVKANTRSSLEDDVIAIGGTGSDFFDFCLENFVSNDVDIVLVELSDNDRGTKYGSAVAPMERLTRHLLNLPSWPAVMYVQLVGNLGVNTYAGKNLNPKCENLEDYGQNELVKHYGIAAIRWREIVCPLTSEKRRKHESISELTQSKMISRDGLHIGERGHAQIAYFIIRYFQSIFASIIQTQLPAADSGEGSAEHDYPAPLPQPIFYKETAGVSASSLCWTLLTPNFQRGLFPQTLNVEVTANNGFYYVPPKDSKFKPMHGNGRKDSFCGWATWKRNSHITFGFTIPPATSSSLSNGYIPTVQSRSLSIVVRENDVGTEALVWVDRHKNEARKIKTKRFEGESHVYSVARSVPPGYHMITVRSIGKGTFHVAGIIVGPSDFNGYEYYRQ